MVGITCPGGYTVSAQDLYEHRNLAVRATIFISFESRALRAWTKTVNRDQSAMGVAAVLEGDQTRSARKRYGQPISR